MKWIKNISKLAVGAFLFVMIFWNQPVYRYYTLNGKGMLKDLKIIFLSDLHNSIYGDNQEKLLKMIDDEAPDLILIGGDMSDEKSPILGSKLLYEGLAHRYPMYFVSGNHEHWMYSTDEVADMLEENGIKWLANESIKLEFNGEKVTLLGVKDSDATLEYSSKESLIMALDQAKKDVDPEGYYILLSHRPEHIDLYKQYDFDLALSGHAHGGQVVIPFIMNGLYAPNQGFFPKYAGGYYAINEKMDFIVGRGLSFKKRLPRIGNPPEVVVITFE